MVIDVESVDTDLKALCKQPERFSGDIPLYRTCKKMKFNTRKVTFKDAPEYDQNSFLLLVYLNQVLSIFNLNYTMLKNGTQACDIVELEKNVFAGREFWGKVQDLQESQRAVEEKYFAEEKDSDAILKEAMAKGNCSKRAIERILQRKKRWIDLQEDLV